MVKDFFRLNSTMVRLKRVLIIVTIGTPVYRLNSTMVRLKHKQGVIK